MDTAPSTLSRTPSAPKLSRSPRAHDVSPSPNLAIKKRKPRSSSVIFAANQRASAVSSKSPPLQPLPLSSSLSPSFPQQPPSATATSVLTSLANSSNPKLAQRSTRYSDVKRKGLRHFAIRVSRKVEQQTVTTYNQVADALVAEERALRASQTPHNPNLSSQHALVDEKNIRRRVYDSLNVLMAMGIIAKDKKLISWQGLDRLHCAPHSHDIATINNAIAEKKASLARKQALLAELKDQHARTCAIIDRNRSSNHSELDYEHLSCSLSQTPLPVHHQYAERIGIPFFILSAPKDTSIELEMDQSRQDICFTFNSSFAIYDDREVIRRMMPSFTSSLPTTQPLPVDPVERITLSP